MDFHHEASVRSSATCSWRLHTTVILDSHMLTREATGLQAGHVWVCKAMDQKWNNSYLSTVSFGHQIVDELTEIGVVDVEFTVRSTLTLQNSKEQHLHSARMSQCNLAWQTCSVHLQCRGCHPWWPGSAEAPACSAAQPHPDDAHGQWSELQEMNRHTSLGTSLHPLCTATHWRGRLCHPDRPPHLPWSSEGCQWSCRWNWQCCHAVGIEFLVDLQPPPAPLWS